LTSSSTSISDGARRRGKGRRREKREGGRGGQVANLRRIGNPPSVRTIGKRPTKEKKREEKGRRGKKEEKKIQQSGAYHHSIRSGLQRVEEKKEEGKFLYLGLASLFRIRYGRRGRKEKGGKKKGGGKRQVGSRNERSLDLNGLSCEEERKRGKGEEKKKGKRRKKKEKNRCSEAIACASDIA